MRLPADDEPGAEVGEDDQAEHDVERFEEIGVRGTNDVTTMNSTVAMSKTSSP